MQNRLPRYIPPTREESAAKEAERQRVQDLREKQGYTHAAPRCWNCARLDGDRKIYRGTRPYDQYEQTETLTNPRCGIGGFTVLPHGICSLYKTK